MIGVTDYRDPITQALLAQRTLQQRKQQQRQQQTVSPVFQRPVAPAPIVDPRPIEPQRQAHGFMSGFNAAMGPSLEPKPDPNQKGWADLHTKLFSGEIASGAETV